MTDLDLSDQIASPTGSPLPVTSAQEPARTSAPRRPTRHRVRWIALVVALGLGGVGYLLATAPPTTQYEADSPLIGHRAPAVSGRTLTGQQFDLGALRGHFVVIDFFASWCVPCRTEQPQLVRFAEHPRADAQLVGVVFQDSTASIRSLLGPWVGLYPVLTDPTGTIALNYGVDNPPSKYVIDPDGRIIAKIVGPVTAAGLDAVIQRAQAEGL
jgi:cytochrome c biogenesis protein CcmG/thiol:disulfide interchange protein DsbE